MENRNPGSLYAPRVVTLSRSTIVRRGKSSTNHGPANRKETVVRPSSLVAGMLSSTRNKLLPGYRLQLPAESPRVILHCFFSLLFR